MTTPPQPTSPARSFVRDVFINVLANLVAAAIIYLLAVLGGYLKSNPFIMVFAVVTVGAAVVPTLIIGGVWYTTQGDYPRQSRITMRLIAGAIGIMLVALVLYGAFGPATQ